MPDPCDYDSEDGADGFHAACMAERQTANPDEPVAQSNAICYSMWAERDCEDDDDDEESAKAVVRRAREALRRNSEVLGK